MPVLDVAQLLKHMLGLGRSCQWWTLCCLWFEFAGPIAEQHCKQLSDFAERIGSDASHLAALMYQEMFARMLSVVGQEHADYMEYRRDRYVNRSMLYSSRERGR